MQDQMQFEFASIPHTLEALQALPEASLMSPHATAALTVLVLCGYEQDPNETYRMLDYLSGPKPLSPFDKQFLRDRLSGKYYKPYSFFEGARPENNYTANVPYRITVSAGPYSYGEPGYAKLQIRSSGADSVREIKLRQKGSTGEWFLWENYLLADIRQPVAADPWA